MQGNFRTTLKQETDAHHLRVDTAFSKMDITGKKGFVQFLSVHHQCFRAMADVAGDRFEGLGYLTEMIVCIDRDLARFSNSVNASIPPALKPADPLALDYMIEGSRLGTQVLRRRWATSTNLGVLTADAYFSLKPVAGRWRAVCDALSDIPVNSSRAARITSDVQDMFDMFYRVSQTPNPTEAPILETNS